MSISIPIASEPSFLFYDLETFGRNKQYDRIAQAAYIRTDMDLNVIDENILYCQIPDYYLPHPDACLINGLTPQYVNNHGISEDEFAVLLRKEFMTPNTVVVGFNNLEFDDKFIRSLFYRTLYNPYEHEWENTRWDILNLAKAVYSLRPSCINWPDLQEQEGYPVFKLTELTKANSINQEGAHDAMVDVKATIEVAKLIKEKNPKLYGYYFSTRTKDALINVLRKPNCQIMLLTQFFHNDYWRICTHPLMQICFDNQDNPKAVYCYDLLFGVPKTIQEAEEKSAIIKVELNKCPFIAPVSVMTDDTFSVVGLQKNDIINTRTAIITSGLFNDLSRIREKADQYPEQESGIDYSPEVFKYRGFPPRDVYWKLSKIKEQIKKGSVENLHSFPECHYYDDLITCYIGNNYPGFLNNKREKVFNRIKTECLWGISVDPNNTITLCNYEDKIKDSKEKQLNISLRDITILEELEKHYEEIMSKYSNLAP